MNQLRRLRREQPVLFWLGVFLVSWLAFQVVLGVITLVLGPLGLPSWAPIVVLVGVLVVIARRQERSR